MRRGAPNLEGSGTNPPKRDHEGGNRARPPVNLPPREGRCPPTTGASQAARNRPFWASALPELARHVVRTMAWSTLLAGCSAGTVLLAVLAHFARTSHAPLDDGALRLTFIPAIAALAFVVRAPFRAVAQSTPVPAWVMPAGQVLLAVPVLAATCWVQLRLVSATIPAGATRLPATYPLIAQLVGWCALVVAAAACCERSRYADVGGAIAVAFSPAVVAVAWYTPELRNFVVNPPATPGTATTAWGLIAVGLITTAWAAARDSWPRYSRRARWASLLLWGTASVAGARADQRSRADK
jgi:hypothetical protein